MTDLQKMATGIDDEELLMEVQGSIYPLDLAAFVSLAEYLKVTKKLNMKENVGCQ